MQPFKELEYTYRKESTPYVHQPSSYCQVQQSAARLDNGAVSFTQIGCGNETGG